MTVLTTGSTGTGLDKLVDIIVADPGLDRKISDAEIEAGAQAADGMNQILLEAIRATGVAYNGALNAADIRTLSDWIIDETNTNEAGQSYKSLWLELHGDDEGDAETGFHLVQDDGASSRLYGRNAVDTVADGLYHLGFAIDGDRLQNEDGNDNAHVKRVAEWLNDLLEEDLAAAVEDPATSPLIDPAVESPYVTGSTGTGLDKLIDIITSDPRLNDKVSTDDINEAAQAADGMNQILLEAIRATGVAYNGVLNAADIRTLSDWIIDETNTNEAGQSYKSLWLELHGDDEGDAETGFHLVQDDGASSRLYGRNAVDTVADGLYHLGFAIEGDRLQNEDGNDNAHVKRVAEWLNDLLEEDLAAAVEDPATSPLIDPAVESPYVTGSTGTGLDKLIDIITSDPRLNDKVSTDDINEAAQAADGMNQILLEAIRATGVAYNGALNAADIRTLSDWIIDETNTNEAGQSYKSLWLELHGDDEGDAETGFHLVQDDGASSRLYGRNAVDTVADGLYHLGFAIEGNRLQNEDGNDNAHVKRVAEWLNDLLGDELAEALTQPGDATLIDLSVDSPYAEGTTGTGLDAIVSTIINDRGLNRKISTEEISEGAQAADGLNGLLVDAIKATGIAYDGTFTAADLRDVSAWLQAEQGERWAELHGDDEGNAETGFHLVQDDGAWSRFHCRNAIDTVADGIYHLGFGVNGNRLVNEDGNDNAYLPHVAEWLNDILEQDLAQAVSDPANSPLIDTDVPNPYELGSTGTGLDLLVDIITEDAGLARKLALSEITEGAEAADGMNQLLVDGIQQTGVARDGRFDADDIRDLNAWIRDEDNTLADGTSVKERWITLHGDDEGEEETGFHEVQNDGAQSRLFGRQAVDKVADGLYHLGFEIKGDRLLNEDGNANVRLEEVADWLNRLLDEDMDTMNSPMAGTMEGDLLFG